MSAPEWCLLFGRKNKEGISQTGEESLLSPYLSILTSDKPIPDLLNAESA